MTKTSIALCLALALAPLAPVWGADLNQIARSWQHYTTQCQQIFQDYRGYMARLPARNPGGDPTQTISPDGRAINIYLEIEDGYVEAIIDILSDREIQHCAFYTEIPQSWDATAIAAQYVAWMRQNSTLEIVGGHAPIYGYDHYRHTILGMWPGYDLEVQSNIHENEFQIFSTRVVKN